MNHENKRFYRYIMANGTFVGEAAYHYDNERRIYIADVIVYAPRRGKGYGRQALQMLCDAARENGITELYDDIAIDNPADQLFKKYAFEEIERTDEYVLLRKRVGVEAPL